MEVKPNIGVKPDIDIIFATFINIFKKLIMFYVFIVIFNFLFELLSHQ